jgi:multidrug resistance efflux pump
MGPVVEWARRWLGVAQLEAENRLLRADLRRVELALEQLQANVAAAEKVAARAQAGDVDALSRIFAVLRRGR